tara:strand:- start:4394 stop:5593 length:1200 start_codon:yes stop_codon:yes gene_type:complete
MENLKNKKILLIICGGIAAYKSLELIRLLKKNGSTVKTILTKNAKKFITPLSVVSLSQEKIYSNLFDFKNEAEMDHISLSRWSDVILIAPATANTISKLANGVADDLASTVVLASNKKIFLAPAMNVRMWEHVSNKKNINKLIDFGYRIIGPEIGDMACGEYGQGKMTEPLVTINYLDRYFKNLLNNSKLTALVTAGPTHEYIDPIRYMTNRSSGKQGYEIAKCLQEFGIETTLITGPTNLSSLEGVKTIKVKSGEEMFKRTLENLPSDIAIFSAAVSDWKVKNYSNTKIKKEDDINLEFERNIDILNHVSNHNSLRPKIVIGFSAETNNLLKNSKVKIEQKNCDWIIANNVSDDSIGFESDYNEVTIFYKDKSSEKFPKMKKSLLAKRLVEKVISQIN